ncbi:hypothetical protein ACG7TL_000907 [Trametes sanguinea]
MVYTSLTAILICRLLLALHEADDKSADQSLNLSRLEGEVGNGDTLQFASVNGADIAMDTTITSESSGVDCHHTVLDDPQAEGATAHAIHNLPGERQAMVRAVERGRRRYYAGAIAPDNCPLNNANMTTIHNTNVACCTIPVVKSNYKPKGFFKSYAGFSKVHNKTSAYVAGPEKLGKVALVCVYDILGFMPQTQQGADILADKLGVQVLMPDFFEPEGPFPAQKFPPKNDEEAAELQAFFGGTGKPENSVANLIRVGKALKEEGVEWLGVYGLCWGPKVAVLAGADPATPFDAVAACHPAMLSHGDVTELKVPLGLYPSKDEPVEEMKQILEIVSKKSFASQNDHKFYASPHGFGGARADLEDPQGKQDYEDLYARLVGVFGKLSGIHAHGMSASYHSDVPR